MYGGYGWGGKGGGWGGKGYGGWDGGKGMMMGAYGGMMPPMYGGYGKGKGKGSPQLNVDASKKLWIGNIPEQATWKDLQTLVDQVVKSRWVEIFRGRGKGSACVVYGSSEEAEQAKASLNGADLCGSSIVVDAWEKGSKS
mmetsp:Transcript_20317/g.45974  ORF Transcript_20317/g.45974 Transcript_20317/m.45974 type:complete len:140 (-) Transcript_20317:114-533(-)